MTLEQKSELDNLLDNIHIDGPYAKEQLQTQALAHYKKIWENTPFMLENVHNASNQQIEQWMVNYIRHKLTGYDEALTIAIKIIPSGPKILKRSILDKISFMYPFLKDECKRQKEKLDWLIW